MRYFLILISITSLLALAFLPANGQENAPAPLWQQNFDEQVSGEVATGWGIFWGEQGDDLILVNNRRALSGTKSLLLDRKSGVTKTMYGCGPKIPDVTEGWAQLSWDILVQGAGADARFSYEIRSVDGGERVVNLNVINRDVNLVAGNWITSVTLGSMTENVWYRITLWMPTKGNDGKVAYALLERQKDENTWERVNTMQQVPAAPPTNGYGQAMLITAPEKHNYLLFMDDFQLIKCEKVPMQ